MRLSTVGLTKQLKVALGQARQEDARRYDEAVKEAKANLTKSIADGKKAIVTNEKILQRGNSEEIIKHLNRYPRVDEISPKQKGLQRAVDLIELVVEGSIDSKEANKLIGNVLDFL